MYDGLRDWVAKLEPHGEVRRLSGAHWRLEIGGITEMAHLREGSPALLFDEIPDYPPGYRVLSNVLGSVPRIAFTLGFGLECTAMELIQRWRERARDVPRLAPEVVKTGPVQEHVQKGSDVDLLRFPTPLWHEQDGGRYIGTADCVITRGPEGGWVNVGAYRVMLHDRSTVGLYISPGKQGRRHLEAWWQQGKPAPVAVSLGQDPLLYLVAGIEVPAGVSEYEYAGGLRGVPLQVLDLPDSGLPVPADAEIVLEGEMHPGELRDEGPFGEWTGYYATGKAKAPVMRVTRVLHRTDPILLGSPPTKPPCEETYYRGFLRSAIIWESLEKAGIPDIRGVWCHPAGGSRLLTIVSIKQRYPGHARQAGMVATQCGPGAYLGRFVVVVDEDIDPANTNDVLWAICTRCDPATGIEILRRCWSSGLDPLLPHGAPPLNSRAILDACRPYEWKDEFSPVAEMSPEWRAEILRRWEKAVYG